MSWAGDGVQRAQDFGGTNGGERIQAAIAAAEAQPGHHVVEVGPAGRDRDGRWLLTQPIELPSHIALILEGAQLFLADHADCKPGDKLRGTGVAGLRLGPSTRVCGLRVSDLLIDGFETGAMIDQGVQGEGLRLEDVTRRGVGHAWDIADADIVPGAMTIRSR